MDVDEFGNAAGAVVGRGARPERRHGYQGLVAGAIAAVLAAGVLEPPSPGSGGALEPPVGPVPMPVVVAEDEPVPMPTVAPPVPPVPMPPRLDREVEPERSP